MIGVFIPASKIYKVLTKLAQRTNPECKKWRTFIPHTLQWKCNICDKVIEAGAQSSDHAILHLKENNLLVFL